MEPVGPAAKRIKKGKRSSGQALETEKMESAEGRSGLEAIEEQVGTKTGSIDDDLILRAQSWEPQIAIARAPAPPFSLSRARSKPRFWDFELGVRHHSLESSGINISIYFF